MTTTRGGQQTPRHDVVIRSGAVYDGSGGLPREQDVAIDGDRIVAVGAVTRRGVLEVDGRGLAVCPGLINMLSWSNESLLVDGRSQSDIRQGVTTEILGEGESMGPLTEEMRERMVAEQRDIRFDVSWTTLAEYLQVLEARGISPNVGSYVGATTLRVHEVGYAARRPSAAELAGMRALLRRSLDDGAVGVSSALIYAPGAFADAAELTALAEEAARAGALYASHIRSEGNGLADAVIEFLNVARSTGVRAELFHLKALGERGRAQFEGSLGAIESARADGLSVTADMYPYEASGTGLDASMPPWVLEGGQEAWLARLANPEIRRAVIGDMRAPSSSWESHLRLAQTAENVLLAGFASEDLRHYRGRTLAEVAADWGLAPEEAAIELVLRDRTRVEAVYFNQSDETVRRVATLPWVSFCSDEASQAPEGVFLNRNPHPRAYGTFARVLGRFARDEQLLPFAEAVRRMTSLPATTLGLDRRGRLKRGYYADIVVLDDREINDQATYSHPHAYAVGVKHVFVNGVHTLADGAHTGAFGGRALRARSTARAISSRTATLTATAV